MVNVYRSAAERPIADDVVAMVRARVDEAPFEMNFARGVENPHFVVASDNGSYLSPRERVAYLIAIGFAGTLAVVIWAVFAFNV